MKPSGPEIVTEEKFPYGVRCFYCHQEILIGEAAFSLPGDSDWLTERGYHANAYVLVCEECFPKPERSPVMAQELELTLKVRTTSGDDLGSTLMEMIDDADQETMSLITSGYEIDVVVDSIKRSDGLPLLVNADFLNWCLENPNLVVTATGREAAHKAFIDARKLK